MLIGRGLAALDRAEKAGPRGPYTLQAAIAACHARARTAEETDWIRIAALYAALAEAMPSPVVELNRAVALGMALGPGAGLEHLDGIARSEEHTSELQSLMRISYAVFCLKKQNINHCSSFT